MSANYLLDTHALLFWFNKENVSDEFVRFFDDQNELERLFISSISFWEIALLVKKCKIELDNVETWRINVLENSNIKMINPSASEMIDSVNLPDIHKDPFDRLLIVQANVSDLFLVTKDEIIKQYKVKNFWL